VELIRYLCDCVCWGLFTLDDRLRFTLLHLTIIAIGFVFHPIMVPYISLRCTMHLNKTIPLLSMFDDTSINILMNAQRGCISHCCPSTSQQKLKVLQTVALIVDYIS